MLVKFLGRFTMGNLWEINFKIVLLKFTQIYKIIEGVQNSEKNFQFFNWDKRMIRENRRLKLKILLKVTKIYAKMLSDSVIVLVREKLLQAFPLFVTIKIYLLNLLCIPSHQDFIRTVKECNFLGSNGFFIKNLKGRTENEKSIQNFYQYSLMFLDILLKLHHKS